MKSEEILESIRELLYDLEHAQNDDRISDLFGDYLGIYPLARQRDWKSIDPQFKPGIRVDEIISQWGKRIRCESAKIKKAIKSGQFWVSES